MAFDAKARALVSEVGGGTQANGARPVGVGGAHADAGSPTEGCLPTQAPDVADPDVGAGWAGMACGRVGLKDSGPDADCEAPGSRGSNPKPTLPLVRGMLSVPPSDHMIFTLATV